jgi:outer membrane protein insertion porin family
VRSTLLAPALFSALFVLAGCGKATPERPPALPAPTDDDKPRSPPPKVATPCSDSEDGVLSFEEIAAKKVRYVRYCGVGDDRLEELDTLVHVKTGSPLDLEKLTGDVRTQFAAGVFLRFDVVARRTPQADAVDVELHVQLSPYANSFTIEGATNLPPDDPARQAIQLEATAPPAYVRRKADELRDRYRAWGFEDVQIERVVTLAKDDTGQDELVDITLRVSEGKRTTLGAISMAGVSKENEAELRKQPALAPGQNLSDASLATMRKLVSDLYRDRGYFTSEATVDRGPRDADFTAPLSVKVTEGPRYRIADIKFDVDGTSREVAMRRLAKVRLGEFVDQVKARADAKRMTEALEKVAPDLKVEIEIIVDRAKPVVDLLFKEKRGSSS